MIQLYAKMDDLTPTETYEQVCAIAEFTKWAKSIVQDGIKHPIHVDHEGIIRDGNTRYWIRNADQKKFIPINAQYYFALQLIQKDTPFEYFHVHPDVREYISQPYTLVRDVK